MARLREAARAMGVADVRAAPAGRWSTDPLVSSRIGPGRRPLDIMPDAKSVVVVAVPIQKTVLDTAPSIYYNHLYNTVNALLDGVTERLALELNIMGHRAVYVPRDGYHGIAGLREDPSAFFSHRHAAYLAGMGTFGWNNMLLTEEYGPRVRFSSVITSAELPYGEVMERQLCIGCGKCARVCPVHAISSDGYPSGITLKQACVENSAKLAAEGRSPCGRCIAACPVGRDGGPPPTPEAVSVIRSYRKPPKT